MVKFIIALDLDETLLGDNKRVSKRNESQKDWNVL